jgi:predicted secreted protein
MVSGGYEELMTRTACIVALALSVVPAVAAAPARAPITQASSGKTFHLAKGQSATLRLSERWRWSEPAVSSRAVGLTPVEYLVDPGFREWTIKARKRGVATIRAYGRPNCSSCTLMARRFRITIVVG